MMGPHCALRQACQQQQNMFGCQVLADDCTRSMQAMFALANSSFIT